MSGDSIQQQYFSDEALTISRKLSSQRTDLARLIVLESIMSVRFRQNRLASQGFLSDDKR